MTIYYVRKDGDDSTGNGSTGTPWLTISKALTVAAGGDTVNIGAGTYAENTGATGYFFISRNAASELVIQSESGVAADVIITGTNHATYNVLISTGSNNLTFKKLSFAMATAAPATCIRQSSGSNIKFIGCNIAVNTASGTRYGIGLIPSTGQTLTATQITGCTFTTSGGNEARAILTDGYPATTPINNPVITGNIIGSSAVPFFGTGIVVLGATNATISDNSVVATIYAIAMGVDGVAGQVVSGAISGNGARSTTSHALLVGAAANGVTVSGNTVIGGDQGIVVKECTNVTVTGNTITAGTTNGLYFKGATASTAQNNAIYGSVGSLVKVGVGDTGNKSGTITLTSNRITATGTASIFTWATSTGDAGGCICNNNRYRPSGTAKFGAVRGDTDVQNLTELRAAWADYDVPTNDSASGLIGDDSFVVIMRRLRR